MDRRAVSNQRTALCSENRRRTKSQGSSDRGSNWLGRGSLATTQKYLELLRTARQGNYRSGQSAEYVLRLGEFLYQFGAGVGIERLQRVARWAQLLLGSGIDAAIAWCVRTH